MPRPDGAEATTEIVNLNQLSKPMSQHVTGGNLRNLPHVQAAGGVVCRSTAQGWETVIVGSGQLPQWRLPKGLVEPDEAVHDAALREVREETGVVARIESELGVARWTYVYEGQTYEKETTFFLMFYVEGNLNQRDKEFERAIWWPLIEVVPQLHFESEREIVRKAIGLFKSD